MYWMENNFIPYLSKFMDKKAIFAILFCLSIASALTSQAIADPTVSTGIATSVTSSSATLNGTVTVASAPTYVRFDYGTPYSTYGSTTSTQTLSSTGTYSVSMGVSDLTPGTSSYFRIVAGDTGTATGSAMAIPTLGTSTPIRSFTSSGFIDRNDDGSSPLQSIGFTINFFGSTTSTLYANNNANITFDSAYGGFTALAMTTVNRQIVAAFLADLDTSHAQSNVVTYGTGTVGSNASFNANYLDVGYFPAAGDKLNRMQIVLIQRSDTGTSTNFDIEYNFERILWDQTGASVGYANYASQTYDLPGSRIDDAFLDTTGTSSYRLAYNSFGTSTTGRYIFEVRDGAVLTPPTVSTGTATSIYGSSATLYGTVTPNGTTTTALFRYGTVTGSYTGTSTQSSVGSGTTATTVSIGISELSPNTTYYYLISANNGLGTSTGSEASFSTSWDLPTVTTNSATDMTTNSATLNGEVSTNGTTTTALFHYGTVSGSYTGTSTQSTITGSSTSSVSASLSSLSSGTTYYYRAVANNVAGTSTGSEVSFATSSPSAEPPPKTVTLSVNSTSPTSGEAGVPVTTAVSATFNMSINGSTVTTESFKLSSDSGEVGGSVATNGATITFTPSVSLSYGTQYTATITTKVQAANAAGTSLSSNNSWSFTTESAPAVTTPQTSPTLVPSPAITTTPATTPSPAASATPQPSPSPTPTVSQGVLEMSKEVAYLAGDTVVVTVADDDRNTSTQAEEILTTAIKIFGDNYYIGNDLLLDLNEDGADSGTFLATIKTGTTTIGGASAASRSNIGMVKTEQGGTVRVAYNPSSAVSVTKKLSFSSFDATLAFSRPAYLMGEYAEVTLSEAESNADPKGAETLLEKVYVQTSQFNIAGVRMLETGTDTGVFRGSIQISADSTLDYERIQATGGNTLTAGFYDETTTTGFPQLVNDACSVAALPVPTVTSTAPTPVPSPSITPAATAPVPSPTPTAVVCGDAEKITVSPDALYLEKGEEGQVTVAVADADGCGIEGIKVKRKVTTSNNKKIKVKPSNQETDAEGRAVFTITAKKDKCSQKDNCNAKAGFKANGVKEKAEVTVWLVK